MQCESDHISRKNLNITEEKTNKYYILAQNRV